MGLRMCRSISIGLAALALALPARAVFSDESSIEDGRYGFKMRAPTGWTRVPTQVDEKWIAAKFQSNREYADKKEGFWGEKPLMNVLVFTEEARKHRGATVEKKEDTTVFILESPYKDYRDYLKRTQSGGGWYLSKEEKGVIDGVEVEFLEAKVEKNAYGGNKRILAWVFHREDADFAVHVEVYEDWYDKLKTPIEASFKSFRFIPRTKAAPSQVTTGETILDKMEEDKLSPAERRQHRIERQERYLAKAIAGLPKGWTVIRYPNLVVLSHVDRKVADFFADQALAVLDWCETKFGAMSDEFVRTPVIRICKDSDEERAFSSSGGNGGISWWNSNDQEFVTNGGGGFGIQWETKWINGVVSSFWFREKDSDFAYAMPRWLREGLEEYLSSVIAKNKKLVFSDVYTRADVIKAAKDGTLKSPRELMVSEIEYSENMTNADFQAIADTRGQCAFLVRYLVDGAGKGGRTKDLVLHYIEAFRQVNEALQKEKEEKEKAEPAKADDPEPTTEEEEEQRMRKKREQRRTVLDDGKKRIAQETFDKVFAGWTDKDWRAVENGFKASVTR